MAEHSRMIENVPRVNQEQLQILERLCNAHGVSGDEGDVRSIVLEQVRPSASQVQVDSMGNVLAICLGQEARLRVMLAAHMDEVGLMVTGDDEDDFFRFETIGGIDARQLVGKPVRVGPERIEGVIGSKPIHLTTQEERKRSISIDNLRIDVGPNSGSRVKVGDYASFAATFSCTGPSLRAKALDDRLGVATLIELVKNAPPQIDLLAAFTVQEEIGARGAQVAAYRLDPHLAIALDCTPAYDLPTWDGSENTRYNTRLGAGPAIYLADRGTLSDPRLVRHLVESAESAGIPYQFRQPGGGSTDAAVIHKQRGGIPSISISVPGRYLHTAASIVRLADWENTLGLVYTALARMSPELLR